MAPCVHAKPVEYDRGDNHRRIPLLAAERMILVKLHGIELHGIWIERQDFTNQMIKKFHFSSSRTTPLIFVPFVKVDFIIAPLDSLSLSEPSFGL